MNRDKIISLILKGCQWPIRILLAILYISIIIPLTALTMIFASLGIVFTLIGEWLQVITIFAANKIVDNDMKVNLDKKLNDLEETFNKK